MSTPNCRLDRPDPLVNPSDAMRRHFRVRQMWNYVIGAAKGKDWHSYGLPGWDVTFTGTYPEFDFAVFTEQGATGRIIQINLNWTSGTLTNLIIYFDDNDGQGIQPVLPPREDLLLTDLVAHAPKYDFTKPDHKRAFGDFGNVRGDDFYMRENFLAITCIAMCELDDPQDYHFPGMTFTPTLRSDGKLLQMDASFDFSTAEMRIVFTHYPADEYDDDNARLRTMQCLLKRAPNEPYYALGKWLYTRRGNGMISRITALAQ